MGAVGNEGDRITVVFEQQESQAARMRKVLYRAVLLKRGTTDDYRSPLAIPLFSTAPARRAAIEQPASNTETPSSVGKS